MTVISYYRIVHFLELYEFEYLEYFPINVYFED